MIAHICYTCLSVTMNEVNQGMVGIETELCLSLARFYDSVSPPACPHDDIACICDSTPEECAIKDAPFRGQSIQIGLQNDRT